MKLQCVVRPVGTCEMGVRRYYCLFSIFFRPLKHSAKTSRAVLKTYGNQNRNQSLRLASGWRGREWENIREPFRTRSYAEGQQQSKQRPGKRKEGVRYLTGRRAAGTAHPKDVRNSPRRRSVCLRLRIHPGQEIPLPHLSRQS